MSIALPPDFVQRVEKDPFLGQSLLKALETASPVSIRRNPTKTQAMLPELQEISWCRHAHYLTERPFFTKDPLFHAGTYYPQEAGSMFLDTVLQSLELPENPVVLDLCAAPGGKSTLIATHLAGKGLLVSNEVIQARARILKENLIKWGAVNTIVSNNDPADFQRIPEFFDLIVVDAPCSGEGMFRKDHAARDEWSTGNVELCAGRQKRIVMDVWESLQPGGLLVYSTCTFNAAENEENISWLLNELDAELIPVETTDFTPGRDGIGIYALPDRVDTEGFFLAVLRKKGEASTRKLKLKKTAETSRIKDKTPFGELVNLAHCEVLQWNDYTFALPEDFAEEAIFLQHHLRTIKLGTELGEVGRKGLIPHEALSLSPQLLQARIPRISLTLEQALSYLHGDTFPLEGQHGFSLMTYQNEPLGWIKHLGNRFNNLYPKEWRIRMKI
jgi:16S rRNA C967 or C1407 C5-methylase (RsmB/RsmF family)/NOL1/NOP2/fmu family ribosome biogenesis protein